MTRIEGRPTTVLLASLVAALLLGASGGIAPAHAGLPCPRPDLLPDDVVVLPDGFRVEWTTPRLAPGDRILLHRSTTSAWPQSPDHGLRIHDDGGQGTSGATRSVTVRDLPQDATYGLAFFTTNPACDGHGVGYFSGETARSSRVDLTTSSGEIGVGDAVRLRVGVRGFDRYEGRFLPLYERKVTLHSRVVGTTTWTRIATGTTGTLEAGSTNGVAVFTVTPARNTEYQARFPGSGVFAPADAVRTASVSPWSSSGTAVAESRSAVRSVLVRPRVTIATTVTRIAPGGRVTLSGKASPKAAGQTVVVQRHDGSRWVEVIRRPLSATSDYRVQVRPPRGTSRYRVVLPASAANTRGVSNRVEIRSR